eukprot:SAG31_NODE_1753_length_7350_cov_1.885395_6_plen_263_part_00
MGSAILCVWKGDNGATRAFESFNKAIHIVDQDPDVRKLCEQHREGLEAYEGGRLLHDGVYKVELAAGLHCGWAIEGPVGSAHKIDATYLSPNVNMAARMETATAQFGRIVDSAAPSAEFPVLIVRYVGGISDHASTCLAGVHLICSNIFYQQLDEATKRKCRHLDTCLVKGSTEPLEFWSPTLGDDEGNPTLKYVNQYTVDYNAGIDLYLDGKWAEAKPILTKSSQTYTKDKAPRTILAYMDEKGAPDALFTSKRARKLESK